MAEFARCVQRVQATPLTLRLLSGLIRGATERRFVAKTLPRDGQGRLIAVS